jgi:hypothetical protein
MVPAPENNRGAKGGHGVPTMHTAEVSYVEYRQRWLPFHRQPIRVFG